MTHGAHDFSIPEGKRLLGTAGFHRTAHGECLLGTGHEIFCLPQSHGEVRAVATIFDKVEAVDEQVGCQLSCGLVDRIVDVAGQAEIQLQHFRALLRVALHNGYERVGHRHFHARYLLRQLRLLCRNLAEELFQTLLGGFHIDVADDNYGLIGRDIPFLVEFAQCLGLEVLHHRHQADGQPLTVGAAAVELRRGVFEHTVGSSAALAPLVDNHSALSVDFGGVEGKGARPVAQNQHTRVYGRCAAYGYFRDVVYRLVGRCIGVEVGSEFHSYSLKIGDERVAREMLCTVETQVFEKMGETALVFVLKNRTGALGEEEVGRTCRVFVMLDVVGHTIAEGACAYLVADIRRKCR